MCTKLYITKNWEKTSESLNRDNFRKSNYFRNRENVRSLWRQMSLDESVSDYEKDNLSVWEGVPGRGEVYEDL